jgi:hypothetical protein
MPFSLVLLSIQSRAPQSMTEPGRASPLQSFALRRLATARAAQLCCAFAPQSNAVLRLRIAPQRLASLS